MTFSIMLFRAIKIETLSLTTVNNKLFSISKNETLSITIVGTMIFSIAKNDTGNSELKMGHVFAFFA
jgi:hypothetical protein